MDRHHLAFALPVLACLSPLLAPGPPQGATASRPAPPASRPFADIGKLPAPKAGTVRLFLARHGQSVGNATGDDPKLSEKDKDKLTDRGKKDAARLGDAVKAAGVHQLYHSPATRARETADLAAQAAGAKVEAEPLEAVRALTPGKPPAEGTSAIVWLVNQWKKGEDPKLEGGESLAEACKRWRAGAADLRKLGSKAKGPLFAVAHSEVLLAFLAGFDVPELRKNILERSVANASVMAFDLGENGTVECVGVFVPPKE